MWRSLTCPSTSRTLFSGLRVSTHGKQVAPYSVRFLLTSQEGGVGPILPRVPHGEREIVVSCKGRFCPGLFYVAASRVRSLSHLHFTSFRPDKINQNSEAGNALQQIFSERPLLPTPVWRGNATSLCLCLLNINSLLPHLKDLQAHHILSASDVLALTETWLSPTRNYDLTLGNFNWERADRSTCLPEQQLSKQSATFQVHGGVLNYIRQGLDVTESSHSVKGVEYLCLTLHNPIGDT